MQSYRHPGATWLGSPNFTPQRNGHDMAIQPSWVVLHTMVGRVASANARFQQSGQQASATYGVGLDGALYQWVDEADAPWADGNTGTGGVGDNLDAIAIEHEDNGDFNGPRTDALYATSGALVRDICSRYGIPIDRQHVIGHRECTLNAPTACPDALDMDRIVAVAAGAAAGGDDFLMAGPLSDPNAQQHLIDTVAHIYNFLDFEGDGQVGVPKMATDLQTIGAQAAALQTAVAQLRLPAVDPAAVAAALAANTAFLDAVAAHTVALLGRKVSA